jgi:HAMP domain-containing protein
MNFAASGRALAALLAFASAAPALAQSKSLAPGFTTLASGTKVAIMPTDIELFSISAGGVLEPKADWTDAATKHFKTALIEKKRVLGLSAIELTESQADETEEINALHGAIARAIAMHHLGPGFLHLPTKDGKLDWSLGESTASIQRLTGADYALFSWVRDSYASDERKAAMVALALVGVGLGGGMQIGYASLVDLRSGRVLWFNRLMRQSGDLREPAKAAETLNALLSGFPIAK